MYEGDDGLLESTVSPYQEVLDALSSLITKRSRGDKSNKRVIFDVLFEYLKVTLWPKLVSFSAIVYGVFELILCTLVER